jgi:ADP-ribose pyrophosphatase YjhB (NUDIX family)
MRRAVRAIICRGDQLLLMHRDKFGNEYDILVGGGVELGEEPAAALLRKINEETGIKVSQPKLVYIEEAAEPYGTQYIYLCDYVSGEAKVDPNSTEAKINKLGKNLYQPVWRKLSEFKDVEFRTPELKRAILDGFTNGFPNQPIDITNS